MKRLLKPFLSIVLVLGIMLSTSVSAFAASKEVYLSDIRMIYADTYKEAQQILSETKLTGYQLLDKNLNSGSGEIGVWLAYKTTTNIDDAITDIAVMQMGGGYNLGSYQEMIKKSTEEYVAMGEIYLQAIEYFAEAYDADNFLAKAAYRQLNFYKGLDKYENEKLGDLLVDGALSSTNLATLFLQGNAKVLSNIRSLLAMGVSYNEEGLHYLQRVSLLASGKYNGYMDEDLKDLTADDIVRADIDDIDALCALIAPSIGVFRNMFEELEAYEDELNYEDEEFTDLELKYLEYKTIAEMMRAVEYLDGLSLYDFCKIYVEDTDDYSDLYPLAEAMNDGQIAMTMAMRYYDVVRYSMNDGPEELLDEQISALEAKYDEKPFDVYTGVDRDMYKGNFALTSAALRAEAYTDSVSLLETLFGNGEWVSTSLQIASGVVGAALLGWSLSRLGDAAPETTGVKLAEKAVDRHQVVFRAYGGEGDLIDIPLNEDELFLHADAKSEVATAASNFGSNLLTGVIFVAGAASLGYSAYSIFKKIYDHYNPTYDAVPEAMVDLIRTQDGDRYIKYDVVLEATAKKDGGYAAGDLNAYEGQRWNALYYTKSYEAGKPLLAEFVLSNTNNRAGEGYLAVHRFGEEVCYDLNKYNFSNDSDNIFLSVAQSDKQKSAVEDVPDIVGTIIGAGMWLIAGAAGALVGVGGTLGVQALSKKKKASEADGSAE